MRRVQCIPNLEDIGHAFTTYYQSLFTSNIDICLAHLTENATPEMNASLL